MVSDTPADSVAPRRPDDQEIAMSGWFRLTLGLLGVVLGAACTVQGLGYVEGSVMAGQRIWAVIGPVLMLAGLVLLWLGARARNRRGSGPPA
ncbi:hypothetical protein [Micromonospora gifhornensis]|uniref:Integral membrane protein n=3 Tax=Micromonospora TaxID=1873 RepID=A0A9X0I985_9ACTN|nr:hypothetical protein VAB18032_14450 [Micromonospora maris AB-18-032]KUJ49237.1 hypothetical protein ADL17_09860 [Micromonospora maris]GIJ16424.1 hypothetical protein Vgi01_31080 [Micromonospora gifhornensis]